MPNKLLRRKNVADIKENQKEQRKSRDLETRSESTRTENWTPPPLLPDPTPQKVGHLDGLEQVWLAKLTILMFL
ncbi:MAG: hypothetical protein CM15mV96_510 [uncultured marine virus]|nr:MAG: hypothetical protein CM15mV96_510 [uncultured marine virus]